MQAGAPMNSPPEASRAARRMLRTKPRRRPRSAAQAVSVLRTKQTNNNPPRAEPAQVSNTPTARAPARSGSGFSARRSLTGGKVILCPPVCFVWIVTTHEKYRGAPAGESQRPRARWSASRCSPCWTSAPETTHNKIRSATGAVGR